MSKTVIAGIGIVAVVCLLVGCASHGVSLSESEKKVNAAFPVIAEVQSAKAAAFELASRAQKNEIDAQLNTRLRQRALNCAKEYSPPPSASEVEIREKLNNPSCFAAADKEIVAWLALRKTGLILALPPLVPIPAIPPSLILSDTNIQDARFADKAGVALLRTQRETELVDLGTMQRILGLPSSPAKPGPLSPNGRLFITSDAGQLSIRDTLTGTVISEIPSVWPWEFHWLDERTAFYVDKKLKSFFIDFSSGEAITTKIPMLVLSQTVPIPDAPNQYAVLTGSKAFKFELVRSNLMPELKLLTEKTVSQPGLASNTSGTTSDGKYFFTTGSHLTLLNLSSLESEEISLEPFYFQTSLAAPNPDNIIVTGFIQPHDGSMPRDYVYSISKRSLAQIMPDKQNSLLRRIYISPFRKLGIISGNTIALTELPQTEENIPLPDFARKVASKSEQNKIAIAERKQALERSCHPSNEMNKDGVELHAVGIYEGPLGQSKSAKNKVDIAVYRSEQPIVLALFNYEPVTWNIRLDKGAAVREIIVNSTEGTQLTGINEKSIKVTRQNFRNTADEDCKFFRMVAPKLKEFSGLNVTSFQGAYRGIGFPIRPQNRALPAAANAQAPATIGVTELEAGLAAYERGEYRTAREKLMPLAEIGVAMAQNTIGKMYLQGQEVQKDYGKALLLFRKAAKQKLPSAQNNLAVMYAGGYGVPQDFKQAIEWFEKAASQGYTIAANNLADIYEQGTFVNKNPIEAEKWRYRAQGMAPARNNEPLNVKFAGDEDYEKAQAHYYEFEFKDAAPLFLAAAKKGHPEAQLKLASMYQRGQGVEKNKQQAKYWEKKAAAAGYSDNDGRDRIYVMDSSSSPSAPALTAVAISSPPGGCRCSSTAPHCCSSSQPAVTVPAKPESIDSRTLKHNTNNNDD